MFETPSFECSWDCPYPSCRMPVLGDNMVATSQPLAAQAGLRMLMAGGNAVDAALATAIALTVVEPTGNGIGSDAFALVWDGGTLHGFNGSGRSPRAWSAERFKGLDAMPQFGWDAVTVPGAVDLWAVLSRRFGRLPFERLFEPAIGYARDGYPVAPIIAARWSDAEARYRLIREFADIFLPEGRAPRPGERFRSPWQAESLEAIARTGGRAFYVGELADRMIAHCRANGGVMAIEDLAGHRTAVVDPIFQDYRNVRLHEIPPNGQGVAALITLGILGHFDLAAMAPDSPDSLHLQIEAMKIGFAAAHRFVADPREMPVSVDSLLDPDLLARQADDIRMDRAGSPVARLPHDRGTVYLAAADAGGMMVSMIQSNFTGFGSGVVIPESGIHLQNRGWAFSLDPAHPNRVAGGKRPYHTIIPGFVTSGGRPLMSLGVMGGHMQPQGHVQMMVRVFDHRQNPQAACDAPRWHLDETLGVNLEAGFPEPVRAELRRRGHRLVQGNPFWGYGGAQLIWRLPGGGYGGASDKRKDGQAVAF
ncbi:MAG: gamma-glutamyltransferase family protein [Desulfobacterales bacterium]